VMYVYSKTKNWKKKNQQQQKHKKIHEVEMTRQIKYKCVLLVAFETLQNIFRKVIVF
jgi:hypothetical protein